MTLEVGVNSYVTLEEADDIVDSMFMSTNELSVFWKTLSNNDKSAVLNKSRISIDNLKLDGRRASTSQRLEFPRVRNSIVGVGYRLFVSQYEDNSLSGTAPQDGGISQAKKAQVVNAVYAAYLDKESVAQLKRNVAGLTSKKAGPIAESYGSGQYNSYTKDMMVGIFTKEVYAILTPWVCTSRGGI